MSVVVVATVHPMLKHREEVIVAFQRAIESVHANDEGCELYALHSGDDRLVMIEKWASPELLQAHGRGQALKQLGADLKDKVVGALDVQVLAPHQAGTKEQGSL